MNHILNQTILPAVRRMKDLEYALSLSHTHIALLDTHVAQIKPIIKLSSKHKKKVLLHADLVQGLKSDEHAAEFLCQEICPSGLISTRSSILAVAKKKGLLTIQRIFLLDSLSLETSYRTFEKVKPDIVEILPGIAPSMIREVRNKTQVPVIAGGLIRTKEEMEAALQAGASAVSTSSQNLWNYHKIEANIMIGSS